MENESTDPDNVVEFYELGTAQDGLVNSEQPDWSSVTVAVLKAELAERGLHTTGRKVDLIARLEASDSGLEHLCELESQQEQEHELATEDTEVSHNTTIDEAEDEIPESDEFVEWNEEDNEHEVIDEVKDSSIESKDNDIQISVEESVPIVDKPDDAAEQGIDAKSEVHAEKGEPTTENKELSVDIDGERDRFFLIWQSGKIAVPFKGEIVKDLNTLSQLQTVIVYPVTVTDVYCEEIRKCIEAALSVDIVLEELALSQPTKGYLKLKFRSYSEAKAGIENLKSLKDGITVKQFCSKSDDGSAIMNKLRKEEAERPGYVLLRLIYVGNVPNETTESSLKELFPEASQVIIPYNEETTERLGYVYLECKDEKNAKEVAEKYKDAEIDGRKLYVIPAIAEKREGFGLLRDSLRLYWLERINGLQKMLDRPNNRSQREISDIEEKLKTFKRRIEKDNQRRQSLHLPLIEYVEKDKKEDDDVEKATSATDKEKTKEDLERRKSQASDYRRTHTRSRSRDRDRRSSRTDSRGRRSPKRSPPRRDYRQQRSPNYSRREEVADKLVNQLQGLVSALTHKLPAVESSRSLRDDLDLGSLAGLLEPRRLTGSSGNYRAGNSYGGGPSYERTARYSSGGGGVKRYNDGDDGFGADRRRRDDYYSSNQYDDRYRDGRRDNNSGGGKSNRYY